MDILKKVKINVSNLFKLKVDNQDNSLSIWDDILTISQSFSNFENLNIVFKKQTDPAKYVYTTNNNYKSHTIYVSTDFKKDLNFLPALEEKIRKNNIFLGKESIVAQELVLAHEIGHAKHHETIGENNPIAQPVKFKQFPTLDYLYNGSALPSNINIYLSEIFKESYADCFSGLIIYKKYGDISIFDTISEFRKNQYDLIKQKNTNLIHPNADYESVIIFKKELQKIVKNINKISFRDIETIFEESIIKGNLKTLQKELLVNDAFINDLKILSTNFKTSNFLIDELIKTEKANNPLISNQELIELKISIQENKIIPFLSEFRNRSNETIFPIQDLLKIIKDRNIERNIDLNDKLDNIRSISNNFSLNNTYKIKDIDSICEKIEKTREKLNTNSKISIKKLALDN